MKTICSWRPEKKYPRPRKSTLKNFSERAAELAGSGIGENFLSLSFVSSRKMEEINGDFLAHKGDTDVICFDYRQSSPAGEDAKPPKGEEDQEEEVLVELLLCPAVAEREAAKRNLPYSRELALYLVHGLLHASGYDDLRPDLKRKMRRAEKRVMNALEEEFSFPSVFPPPLPPPQPAPAPFFPEEGKEKKPRSGRKLFSSPTEKETKTAAPCRKTPHRSRSINTTLEH